MGRWVVVGLVAMSCGETEAVVRRSAPMLEPDTGLYVADHDLPAETLEEALALEDPVASSQSGLTVAQVGGRDDLWSREKRRALTYCIDVGAFGRSSATVERALLDAASDWEQSADVKFTRLKAEDARCTRANANVVFNVRPARGRGYLARSFFPSQRRSVRELVIDASAMPPPRPWSLTGVLRHELGHVLGLRHEHTRLTSNPCFEDSQWRAVTPYDVRSVMHYPQCAGTAAGDLVLTDLDRRGVGALYH